jgi:hypothetical protein
MTRTSIFSIRLLSLYFMVLLAAWACTGNNKPKNRTVLMIDSTYAGSFVQNQLRMKYMSDDGAPNIIAIEAGLHKIILNTRRQHIELAFQNNNIATQYFLIHNGDSALLTEFQDNIGVNILNRTGLPFDENYKTKYRASLPGNTAGVDEFYSACGLMNNAPSFEWNGDADLLEDLLKLKRSALDAISVENKAIDSLTRHDLISADAATFYKFKNTFDSIKISHYQGSRPDNSLLTFLEPFKAMPQSSPNAPLSWAHLTFYDDWMNTYIQQLHPPSATHQDTQPFDDSLRTVILNLDLKDSLIRHTLYSKVGGSKADKAGR